MEPGLRQVLLPLFVVAATGFGFSGAEVGARAPLVGSWVLVLELADEFKPDAASGLMWVGIKNTDEVMRTFCLASAMASVSAGGVSEVSPILPNQPRLCKDISWTQRLGPGETLYRLVQIPQPPPSAGWSNSRDIDIDVTVLLFDQCRGEGVCVTGEVDLRASLKRKDPLVPHQR
jgi:hypothetical protein